MICDILDINKYKYYKHQPGPFVVIFYYKDIDKINYKIYEQLKFLEEKYIDVPIIRFDFIQFIRYFPGQKITSPNMFLIIEKSKENKLFEINDISYIDQILEKVQSVRQNNLRKNNKKYKNQQYMWKPWIVNLGYARLNDIENFLRMPAEIQYKFPNNTSIFKGNKELIKRKRDSQNNKFTSTAELYNQSESVTVLKSTDFKNDNEKIHKLKHPRRNYSNLIKLLEKSQIQSLITSKQQESNDLTIYPQNKPQIAFKNNPKNYVFKSNDKNYQNNAFNNNTSSSLSSKDIRSNFTEIVTESFPLKNGKQIYILNPLIPQNPIFSLQPQPFLKD